MPRARRPPPESAREAGMPLAQGGNLRRSLTVRVGTQNQRAEGDVLWDTLGDCHRRMRAELREVVLARGVYLSEYRALARLREGPRTLTQLAEGLGLTPASMTDLARQLLNRGWAHRRPNPQDRRSHLLLATDAGLRVHALARREYRNRLAKVYSAISPRTRRALAEGLEDLRATLIERTRNRGPVHVGRSER